MFAVVDIETTGGFAYGNRIIEISIFITDGKKVKEKFSTLIDPGISLPYYITSLTGITEEMLETAPTFEQVADHIYNLTHDKIFVAHNVNFDFSFIKQELEACGYTYNPKKLCTVRLSRKIIPGYSSYSLGNLCGHLDIVIKGRHRAEGDAEATVKLLKHLLEQDKENFIEKSLNKRSRETLLPANLPRDQFDNLPHDAGVYYFFDEKGKVIYVGKAIDIKKRIISHFSGKNSSRQSQTFMNKIHGISFELCGNELIALLLESEEIKKHWPPFNRTQKKYDLNVGIYAYEDMQGYYRFCINKTVKNSKPLHSFRYETEARNFLSTLVFDHKLCPKLSGLQKSSEACYDHAHGDCYGACIQQESPEVYNERFHRATGTLQETDKTYIIKGSGRSYDEYSVVAVERGKYLGFGFITSDTQLHSLEDVKPYLKRYRDNQDIQKILTGYLKKESKNIFYFGNAESVPSDPSGFEWNEYEPQ